MPRWEYRVVSLRPGRYTASLNEYGREGWELVGVAPDEPDARPSAPRGSPLPKPKALGRLEDAAAKLNQLGASEDEPVATSSLLWILRRPLGEE